MSIATFNTKETTEELLKWASLADFTARLYLTEPSRENCDGCRRWGAVLPDFFPDEDASKLLTQVDPEQTDDLRQEFFDLFVVPVSDAYIPPLENTYRNGSMAKGLSNTLGEIYRKAGFYPEKFNLPFYLQQLERNDHLGLELEFYANLLYSANEKGTPSEKECLLDTARQFFHEYPVQWAGSYGLGLKEKAKSPYFRALGALTLFISKNAPETTV